MPIADTISSRGSMPPSTTMIDRHLAQRLSEKHAELDRYRPLPPHVVARLHGDLRVELTYHSNAIEGNTLTLRETQLVIEHGMTVGGHRLRDYQEAANHAVALDTIAQLADRREPITTEFIRSLHGLVMKEVLPNAGEWRRIAVHIRGAAHVPPCCATIRIAGGDH
jgi:Fic family protein